MFDQAIFNRALELEPIDISSQEVALGIELAYGITKKERIQAARQALEAKGHYPHDIESFKELTPQELTAFWVCADVHAAQVNPTGADLRTRVRAVLRVRAEWRSRGSRASIRSVGNPRRRDVPGSVAAA